ncbi:MAG: DNA-processing protein DprA [Chitinivibrionia bacterium]|nr:DNA-processing protein DprA [Chitinivibrionia bacterium]
MIYWIALSVADGLGLASKHKLLQNFATPEKIFEQKISKENFSRMKNDVDFTKIKDNCLKSAEKIINFCKRENVAPLCFADEEYPAELKKINQAPLVLYCKGDTKILSERSVAIVGTREPSENGENDAKEISAGLAQNGFVIVSGLAKGVDTFAHNGALSVSGKTVAVMATGINEITPALNIKLARRIIENGGAIITEQVPGKLAFAPNFVMRNRIISGLSECTIIISAPEKSGALRTAEFAHQQGKKVLVAPGNRSDEKYCGSNNLLLKKDVAPALKISGIISYLNGTQEAEQIGIFDVVSSPQPAKIPQNNCSQQEKKLLSFLGKKPISLETLSQKSEISVGEITETLLDLELQGIVAQDFSGNYYLP